MSASTTYTPLRDDTTHRSLSNNERTFLHSCATGTTSSSSSILRTDGRTPGESRPIQLSYHRNHNISECTIQLGQGTKVTSCVTCYLIPPMNSIDRPNDGLITFSVDLSPMSYMGFEYSQPSSTSTSSSNNNNTTSSGGMGLIQNEKQKQLSNRILRILERTLIHGGAIDVESLCVQSGKWVWRLHIDVTVLDYGGNVIDACVLSAVAAMRHFRKPEVQIITEEEEEDDNNNNNNEVDKDNNIVTEGLHVLHSDEKEPTPLPLHHTPLTMTFALFSDPTGVTTTVSALIDPSDREELVMNGNVTFSFNKYGEICSLDFAGGCELKPRQLIQCSKLAKVKCVELCNMLEKSLAEADEKSIEERLARLKVAVNNNNGNMKDLPLPDISENVPFVERTNYDRDEDMMEIDQDDLSTIGSTMAQKAKAIAAAEEESYRIQALDYKLGHVAAKVKENDTTKKGGNQSGAKYGPIFGGSLMDAMLKSAGQSLITNETIEDDIKERSIKASTHTKEADDEIAQYVEQEASKIKQDTISENTVSTQQPMLIDSDEEETTTLHSEFVGLPPKPSEIMKPKPNENDKKDSSQKQSIMDDDDDDLDLTMAIKKKKKKTKKDKK